MVIALDYDGTYTLHPEFWLGVIQMARSVGHEIFCCTMRTPEEAKEMDKRLTSVVQVIATSRQGKREFLRERGITPCVWIDDMPDFIVAPSADASAYKADAVKAVERTKAKLVLGGKL